MAFEVRLTLPAAHDRENIVAYLLDELRSRQAAESFLACFDERVEQIATLPESCPLCRVESLARRGYRSALVGRYVFVYSIDEQSQTIDILRVFHGSQDYVHLL